MKLPRPHIPIPTRIKVARRQLFFFGVNDALMQKDHCETPAVYLDRLLGGLSIYLGAMFKPLHLDHDPALCNRKYSYRTGKYTPDANDIRYLIYRTQADHDIKTRVRGDGAQLSDLAKLRKTKRIAKRIKDGKRPKYGVAR
jgi:hypothetical protein